MTCALRRDSNGFATSLEVVCVGASTAGTTTVTRATEIALPLSRWLLGTPIVPVTASAVVLGDAAATLWRLPGQLLLLLMLLRNHWPVGTVF